jgi:hypothetical protein
VNDDPEDLIACGQDLAERGRSAEAEACFRRALVDAPAGAPALALARRCLARLLVEGGRRDDSLPLWRAELEADDGIAWLQEQITHQMVRGRLALAGEYAAIHAMLRWGTPPVRPPAFTVTVPKLEHDVEQLAYLRRRGVLGSEVEQIIDAYQRTIVHLAARGPDARVALDDDDTCGISDVYNRLLHVRPTPRRARALSDAWDSAAIECRFLELPPGLVVVDNFLAPDALDELRAFCLESTIWSANRYAHGRLGAFFESGFNCPLLLQIADETRHALPRVIGDRYPLRQLWAFKYRDVLPEDSSTHADFAAVSVNLWITPDHANLDPRSGGLVVYDIDAPPQWSFERYQNTQWSDLSPFLASRNARATMIPYRQNRAVIFNSDLFHGTAALRFRPEYENHRINVTMLFGDREDDVHHPRLAARDARVSQGAPAWRSAAWGRRRR